MATFYGVGITGTKTWTDSDATIWSLSSGGAGGAGVPGVDDDVILDASSGSGTLQLGYDISVKSITMGAFGGTFTVGIYSPTLQTFNASGTGVRTINMGSGTWTITGSNATIFTVSTTTNLTLNYETATVNCTYSGSTGTRTFVLGSGASATLGQVYNLNVTAGSDTFNLTASGSVNIRNDLNFTGFSGTVTSGTSFYYGNVTFSPTMTWGTSSTSVISFVATSSKNVDTKGITIGQPVTFNASGGSWTLQSNFVLSSLRTLTVTQGTFNANGYNVTCGLFSSTNSNTRTLTMGSGTWTLTGTGTVWNFSTTTNLTYNVNTSTVTVTDTSSATKSLNFAPPTAFNNLVIPAGGTGNINLTASGGRAITSMSVTGPKTITWASGSSYTITNAPTITSSRSQPVTFLSSTPGTQYTLSVASGTVGSRFMSIFDCIGTGGATFVARESYGNNTTGWTIVPPRINQAMATLSYALNFPNNAAVDVVSASNSGVSANGSWSLCAWINVTGYTGTRQDIHGVNFTPTNSAISVGSTGLYTLNDPIGIVATTVRAPIGRMVPVVTTWDATNARGSMYFDGYLIYTRTGTATAFTDGKIVTGRFAFSAAQPAWATVSRRRIFARDLSAAEVMAWSRDNVEPDSTGLRAQYNLLAKSGSTDVDTSGNGNNGTITSATWQTDRIYTARTAVSGRVAASNRVTATNRVQL